MPVRLLKDLKASYKIGGVAVEKRDLVDMILEYENERALLPLPKDAMRFALVAPGEVGRRTITKSDLVQIRWDHRLREEGHGLEHLVHMDSWHHGGPCCTQVQFLANGTFMYECEPGAPLKFLQDHIERMGPEKATYTLSHGEILLDPFGIAGRILRHPTNWGYILLLPASIWTSWPMPRKGQDPFLDAFE